MTASGLPSPLMSAAAGRVYPPRLPRSQSHLRDHPGALFETVFWNAVIVPVPFPMMRSLTPSPLRSSAAGAACDPKSPFGFHVGCACHFGELSDPVFWKAVTVPSSLPTRRSRVPSPLRSASAGYALPPASGVSSDVVRAGVPFTEPRKPAALPFDIPTYSVILRVAEPAVAAKTIGVASTHAAKSETKTVRVLRALFLRAAAARTRLTVRTAMSGPPSLG